MGNIKAPKRYYTDKVMHMYPRFIIIHSVKCQSLSNQNLKVINKRLNLDYVKRETLLYQNMSNLPFHILFDKIDDDYEAIIGAPLHSECLFEDIKPEYKRSIHIGLLYDMDFTTMDDRAYESLAYKVIVPLSFLLGIPRGNVFLHNEIMQNELYLCPGSFFDKVKMDMFVKKHWRSSIR